MRFEVKGVPSLLAAAKRAEATPADTKKANKAGADVVHAEAETRSPVLSGALVGSGRTSGTKKAGVVRFGRASVPYAGPVHFGAFNRPQGGFIEANPFLFDAADARRAEVVERYEEFVDMAMAKTF